MTASGSSGSWRDRLITEAADLTRREGWSAVTMARLADRVGVSRQTVYNELGSKTRLAENMVLHELDRFLAEVDSAFKENPDNLVEAIRQAARVVLEMAPANPLLHAVLSNGHGAESGLLPLLTTQAAPLFETANLVVNDHVARYDVKLGKTEREAAVDMVIRLVLSHVMQPSATPAETADSIAWMAGLVLRGV
jgi:AcrR family transcriptional regulator